MMHVRTRAKRLLALSGTSALVALSLVVAPTAFGAPAPEDADTVSSEREFTAQVERAITDDGLVETMAALELGGVLGAESRFVDIIAQTEIFEDGSLGIRYFAGSPDADALVAAIEKMSQSTPMRVNPMPVDFHPGELSKLAMEIVGDGDKWPSALGVDTIIGVAVDTATGELMVQVLEEIESFTAEVAGYEISVETGSLIEFQIGN